MKNCLGSNFRRESQGNEEDNFFLNPLVVQVATGVKQVALQNWKALQKTLDFSFLAARFLFPLFFGSFGESFSRTVWTVMLKNRGLHIRKLLRLVVICVFVSKLVWARFDAGHVLARLSSGCQHFLADDTGSAVVERDGAGGLQPLPPLLGNMGVLAVLAMLPCLKRDDFVCGTQHMLGFAAWPCVLWQARLRECDNRETLSSLSDLASSFVSRARLFFFHPSPVSENSCGAHGVGAMNSCELWGGTKSLSTSTRCKVGRPAGCSGVPLKGRHFSLPLTQLETG